MLEEVGWTDEDGDGVQDGGEDGLSGVTVYLDLDGDGVLDVRRDGPTDISIPQWVLFSW